MAKGEQRYSSAGKEIQHFSNSPIPEDDYDLTLLGDGLEIRRSKEQGPNAIPYIGCRMEAQGTAEKEGQKNRLVFQNFFLSLKPGSDGIIMPERGGGLAEFYRAHGLELDVPIAVKTIVTGEGDEAEESEVQYLDPEAVMEQLSEWTDSTIRAHVSVEKPRDKMVKGKMVAANPNDPGRNKIERWFVQEVAAKATGTAGKQGGSVSALKPKGRK